MSARGGVAGTESWQEAEEGGSCLLAYKEEKEPALKFTIAVTATGQAGSHLPGPSIRSA